MKLRQPTPKQIALAASMGIPTNGKTFRVLSAEIADAIDLKSFKTTESKGIKPGVKVEYIGNRKDMPKTLVVSTVALNGFIYFKETNKYCRPWDLKIINNST